MGGLLADAERRGDALPLPTLLACARNLEPFQRVEQRAQRGHSSQADGRIIVGGVAGELRRFLLHESHPTLTQVSSQLRLTAIRLSPPYACAAGLRMRKARDCGPFVDRGEAPTSPLGRSFRLLRRPIRRLPRPPGSRRSRLRLRDHDHVGAVDFRDLGAGALRHRADEVGADRLVAGRDDGPRRAVLPRRRARGSENARSEIGRCVIPMNATSSSERSDANTSRNFAGSIENSVGDPPSPVGYAAGTSAVFRTLSFESAAAAPSISPWSGANAAT